MLSASRFGQAPICASVIHPHRAPRPVFPQQPRHAQPAAPVAAPAPGVDGRRPRSATSPSTLVVSTACVPLAAPAGYRAAARNCATAAATSPGSRSPTGNGARGSRRRGRPPQPRFAPTSPHGASDRGLLRRAGMRLGDAHSLAGCRRWSLRSWAAMLRPPPKNGRAAVDVDQSISAKCRQYARHPSANISIARRSER
jgi:hypothetical protein